MSSHSRLTVILLLTFSSTVIPVFIALDIHDKDIDSLLDMYMFQNGAYIFDEGEIDMSIPALSWHPVHSELHASFVSVLY
jgi:hypothetical protein